VEEEEANDPGSPSRPRGSGSMPAYRRSQDQQQDQRLVQLTREGSFRGWAGRPDKLIRLARDIEKSLEQLYGEYVAKLPTDSIGEEKASRAAEGLQLKVKVTGAGGRLRRSGSMAAILAEMDLREIETIEMFNGIDWGGNFSRFGRTISSRFPVIYIKFGPETDYSDFLLAGPGGIKVIVTGEDRQWVGGIFDVLMSQIATDVPYWTFLRSTSAALIVGGFVSLGPAGLIFAISSKAQQHDLGFVANCFGFSLFFGLCFGYIALRPLFRKLFPALEIVEVGTAPRGRKVLVALVGIVSFALTAAGVILATLAL
jgi:hypothetical protein